MDRLDRAMLLAGTAGLVYLYCENRSLRRENTSLRQPRPTDDLAEEVARLKQDSLETRNELRILRRCLESKAIVLPEAVAAQRHRQHVRKLLHSHPASGLRFEDVCLPGVLHCIAQYASNRCTLSEVSRGVRTVVLRLPKRNH